MSDERDSDNTDTAVEEKAPMDPVRKATFVVLAVCAVLMAWYLASDRLTPYTSQARVNALVVPIAPEVSGTVSEVAVSRNQVVAAGDLLLSIDPVRYQLAVETAEANLQSARQATGASTANVEAARAQVRSAEANLVRAEKDAVRLRRIKQEDQGAISDRRIDSAEASLSVAQAQLNAAQANLERALQDLGQTGEDNSRILQAQAALDEANLNLRRTGIRAPDDGIVTDVRVDRGNFAHAGTPLMTFLATHAVWVQADFTENNLGNIKPGDPVDIVFDALPGRIFAGTIRTTGFGVQVDSAPLGSLPTIQNDREFLRDAQRFSAIVDFEVPDALERRAIRVGGQATVIVYTGDSFILNAIGRLRMWFNSLFTYAY